MKFRGSLYYSSPFRKFLLLIWIICMSFMIMYLFSLILARVIYGPQVFDVNFLANTSNPLSITVMKFMQVFSSAGMFLIPAWLMSYFTYPVTGEYFGLKTKVQPVAWVLTTLLALSLLPLSNFIFELNHMIHFPEMFKDWEISLRNSDKATEMLTFSFVKADTISGLLVNLFVIAVIPAIAEEFFFRGVLQKLFTQWSKNIHWGIVLTALIFSLVHFQFFSFFPRFFLGVVFGYLLYYTGSLWVPILAHFVNNATAVIVFYFIQTGGLPKEAEAIGSTETVTWLFAGIFLSAFSFWFIVRKKFSQKGPAF